MVSDDKANIFIGISLITGVCCLHVAKEMPNGIMICMKII